jgi:hypothetical protein
MSDNAPADAAGRWTSAMTYKFVRRWSLTDKPYQRTAIWINIFIGSPPVLRKIIKSRNPKINRAGKVHSTDLLDAECCRHHTPRR